MNEFKIHTEDTASAPASEELRKIREALGFVPNVFAVIAESSPALQAFVALNDWLANSSLSPIERELVQIATSVENHCSYCVAGHTAFAAMQDLSTDVVAAARCGRPIPDDRLEALHQLTLALVQQKGAVDQAAIATFFAAGYGPQQLLDVIIGVCVKTFSNLTNSVAGIPLDEEFSSYAWEPEAHLGRSATSSVV